MSKEKKLPGWKSLPIGGVILNAGSSKAYDTGNWVRETCKWDKKTCINCNLCWPVCPENAILTDKDGNMIGIDESKCTACGLCITACPSNPKSLKLESKKLENI